MKSTFLILCSISVCVILTHAIPTHAAPRATCEELKQAWYSRYVKDFGINWDTKEFYCSDSNGRLGTEGRLAQSFMDLENAQFVPTGNYRPNFYKFVSESVTRTDFSKNCPYMATGAEGVLTLCPPFFKYPRENRAPVLVHEGRHMDPNDPLHVTCTRGQFKGHVLACDETFYDGNWKGSGFNAEVFYINWVMKGSRKNELNQSVYQSLLNNMIPDRFNNVDPSVLNQWRNQ